MSTDTEVRIRGLRVLVEALGTVEAERFITLMLREPFDYTQWQRHLWTEKSVDEISQAAMAMQSASPNKGMEPTRCSARRMSGDSYRPTSHASLLRSAASSDP